MIITIRKPSPSSDPILCPEVPTERMLGREPLAVPFYLLLRGRRDDGRGKGVVTLLLPLLLAMRSRSVLRLRSGHRRRRRRRRIGNSSVRGARLRPGCGGIRARHRTRVSPLRSVQGSLLPAGGMPRHVVPSLPRLLGLEHGSHRPSGGEEASSSQSGPQAVDDDRRSDPPERGGRRPLQRHTS